MRNSSFWNSSSKKVVNCHLFLKQYFFAKNLKKKNVIFCLFCRWNALSLLFSKKNKNKKPRDRGRERRSIRQRERKKSELHHYHDSLLSKLWLRCRNNWNSGGGNFALRTEKGYSLYRPATVPFIFHSSPNFFWPKKKKPPG